MMKSLRWVMALGSLVLLATASTAFAESRAPLPATSAAQKSVQSKPAEINILAQSDSRKACVEPILACRKTCNKQSKPGSDAWKACRKQCGDAGSCE